MHRITAGALIDFNALHHSGIDHTPVIIVFNLFIPTDASIFQHLKVIGVGALFFLSLSVSQCSVSSVAAESRVFTQL